MVIANSSILQKVIFELQDELRKYDELRDEERTRYDKES